MILFKKKKDVETVQKWINRVFNDPLAEILLNNCHLTKIQAETLLINGLVESILDRKIGYEEKSKMRLSAKGVSRGSFNRTLHQAKKNVIKSIYTVFLLGYLGILETASLDPLIETSNELATYMKEYARFWQDCDSNLINENKVKTLSFLKKELESSLNQLLLTKK